MKTFIYFSLVVLILSCNREYAVDIPNLKEKIDSFIHAKKCFDKQTKIMIVNLNGGSICLVKIISLNCSATT